MERDTGYSFGEQQPPEGFMTVQQYAAMNALPASEAELLIRAAADDINRFNEGLGREIPGMGTPSPIHRYVQKSAATGPTLYFDPSRLNELMGQLHDDTRRYGDA